MSGISRQLRVIFMFVIFNALLFYLGWNMWEWMKFSFGWYHWFFFTLLYILISYSFVFSRFFNPFGIFHLIGSLWFGFFQYALILIPIADLGLWIYKLSGAGSISRTAIFTSGFIASVIFAIIFGYGLFNAYSPVIRKYEITVPKKNGTRSSLRIAVASDMHFGRLSGVGHLKRLVEKIREINPDLILLPGDIIDDDPEPFIQKNMGDMMGRLEAPLGVYGVLGNHEYYGGQIPQFLEEMKKINIKILMDEVVPIDDHILLAGRKDKTDKARKSFGELLSGHDPMCPVIAMDHQPTELKQAQENGVDVLFSGHTHRGQMAPNHLITKRMFELDWGYLKKQQLHAFVSSGYGFWGPPMRLGSRSEILEIEIKFE